MYFHQRALDVHDSGTPTAAMGDFNDEPFGTSLVTHTFHDGCRAVPSILDLAEPERRGGESGSSPPVLDEVPDRQLAAQPVID